MHLISITVRSYRTHKELRLDFDRALTLIGGANESGKSTLAEAAHRALFLRSRTGGQVQREMQSAVHAGDPTVVLEFEAESARWQVEKRFAGPARGSTLLTQASGVTLRDDEAEERLAQLLQSETASGKGAGNLLRDLWPHLWIWQGSAGGDPTKHANVYKDALVQRMQQDGLATLLLTETDLLVSSRITASYDEIYTATGKVKANSRLDFAQKQLAEAESNLAKITEVMERLQEAVQICERAEAEIANVDRILPQLREQKRQADAGWQQVLALQSTAEKQKLALEQATVSFQQISQADAQLRHLQEQILASKAGLAPVAEKLAQLLQAKVQAASLCDHGETHQRLAEKAVRRARLHLDWVTSRIKVEESQAEHSRWMERQALAGQVQTEMQALQHELAALPQVTKEGLLGLQKKEREVQRTETVLQSMAAEIRVLHASQDPVEVEGRTLASGDHCVLTQVGEVRIGGHTALQITPGGGATLSESRRQQAVAQEALQQALLQFGVDSLDHAAAVLSQRQLLDQEIRFRRARWQDLGGESVAQRLEQADTAKRAAEADRQRREQALVEIAGEPLSSQSLPTLEEAGLALQQAETMLEQCLRDAERQRQARSKADEAYEALKDSHAQAQQQLRDLETRVRVMSESWGDETTRQSKLAQAAVAEGEVRNAWESTQRAIGFLNPTALQSDVERLQRAVQAHESKRGEEEKRLLVAQDRLVLDGTTDPHAELSRAQARVETTRDAYEQESLRARALTRLEELFAKSRESIDRNLVQPLEGKVAGYLQCLFGPGSVVRLQLKENLIHTLELVRGDGVAFTFESLSGGAQEQVAAAFRLAMAEMLAVSHGGGLPIIFDDTFAYADPVRVQTVQRMLDLAARRGLQVIVLTCTPLDYAGLGAQAITLG